MRLSIVIVTHNRREALLRTLGILAANPPIRGGEFEVLVVDNGSTDNSAHDALRAHPAARVILRPTNEGVSARNYAFAHARGEYVALIDDDSYPLEDAVQRSLAYMDANAKVGAVVGRVELPDGNCEASALPTVAINCAVCIRKNVLDKVGGFPKEFFRQAEEYDLSFRIWRAGYTVERFEDLVYRHEKVAGNRWPAWIHRLDIRNNLILLERYLPTDLRREYGRDWVLRYRAMARHAGHSFAALQGRVQGFSWKFREVWHGRQTLDEDTIENIFGLRQQADAVAAWASHHNIKRVALADFGKNTYATYRACKRADLDIVALGDANPAFRGLRYRNIPIVERSPNVDGVVLTNVNPAQIHRRLDTINAAFGGPVLSLWTPRFLAQPQDAFAIRTQDDANKLLRRSA